MGKWQARSVSPGLFASDEQGSHSFGLSLVSTGGPGTLHGSPGGDRSVPSGL